VFFLEKIFQQLFDLHSNIYIYFRYDSYVL